MWYKKAGFTLMICVVSAISYAQPDDLEGLLDRSEEMKKVFVKNAFKSSRVINGHSMEMLGKGVLDFRILHRFGTLNSGWRNWFGIDNASMRLGFDYGVSKNLTLGFGRSTFNKEYDGFVKYRIAHQRKDKKGLPLSILWISGLTVNTTLAPDPKLDPIKYRMGYYHQLIAGRKFGEAFTLQLSPTLVHRNLVELPSDKNDLFAIGIGARIKLSNRMALLLDTHPIVYGATSGKQLLPLAIGVDIETGGHVFQLHITNTRGMNEKAFISETVQDWSKGQLSFGFNLSRVFTVLKNTETSW